MKSKIFYKYFLIALGWFFVAMGIIGIFVPIWPTTIFFIFAAWCFAKSSEKFYNWLINHPRFGKFIRNYREHRGMPLKAKIIAVTMVVVAIGSSVIFFTQTMWIRILLVGIALGVSGYILSLNTIRQEQTAVSE